MGSACTSLATNSIDEDYQQQQDNGSPVRCSECNNLLSHDHVNYKIIEKMSEKSSSSSSSQSELDSNAEKKSNTKNGKKKHHGKKRRKSVRKMTFTSCPLPIFEDDTTSNRSNKSIEYNLEHSKLMEILDYNFPNLPIRFAKTHEIWQKEYILFIQTISNIISKQYNLERNTSTLATETILEYAAIDVIYTVAPHLPVSRRSGLWPQHYILDQSKNGKVNEKGMILDSIRDEIVHSFNLHSIFEICGTYFSSTMSANNFFVYGVGIDFDLNSSMRAQGPWSNMISEFEPNEGYTSTASFASSTGCNSVR
eukprot:41522_1